jgi:tetratricopeptide (TPR) repeat protein
MERGIYNLGRQNLPAAKSDLTQAASMNPDSPLIQVNLARVLLATGDNQLALEAAQKANQLDITMLDAYLVLGTAYRVNGQIDQAVEALNTYTSYSLTNADAFSVLAGAYFDRGDYELALKNANQAILLDKSSPEAYRWRGEIYLAIKQPKQALSDFRQSNRNGVTFDATIGVGRAMLADQNYHDAYPSIVEAEKLIKTDQQRAIYLYYRAMSLEGLNEQVAASRDWTALLALPTAATTDDIRAQARAHIIALQSATPPPTITLTITPTPTLTPTPKK